jgi:hypothetical protein
MMSPLHVSLALHLLFSNPHAPDLPVSCPVPYSKKMAWSHASVASAALIPAHCPTSLQQNHGASQNPAPLSVANPAVLELSLVELPPLSEQMLSYFSLLDGLIRLFLYILTCIGISACMPLFLKKKQACTPSYWFLKGEPCHMICSWC